MVIYELHRPLPAINLEDFIAACCLANAPEPLLIISEWGPGPWRDTKPWFKHTRWPKAALALGLLQVTLPFIMRGAAEVSGNCGLTGRDLLGQQRHRNLPTLQVPAPGVVPKEGLSHV